MLSVNYAECHKQVRCAKCHYAECRYAECHYAECHGTKQSILPHCDSTIVFTKLSKKNRKLLLDVIRVCVPLVTSTLV
jgi:hypothetical protein